MSSNGGNRKSMDDVLSSIRRIIGADKKDGYDDLPDNDELPDDAPLTLGAPISEGRPDKVNPAVPPAPAAEPDQDALSLTPNMRVDFTKLTERDDTRIASPVPESDPEPIETGMPGPYPMGGEGEDDEAVVIDEAALEDMIRRVVREELDARAEAEAAKAADAEAERSEMMRMVVRDELMGETGQNISRNVQKLIQAEVAKILAEKG